MASSTKIVQNLQAPTSQQTMIPRPPEDPLLTATQAQLISMDAMQMARAAGQMLYDLAIENPMAVIGSPEILGTTLRMTIIDDKGQVHGEVLTQGMVAFLPAGMTHWTETIGDQTAVLSLSFPAGFKTFELGDSLIQVRRNDKECAASSIASCNEKRKSLILILKDGLI